MKEFSKFEIASIKRTAANVSKEIAMKERLVEKIKALQEQVDGLQKAIDMWQEPIKKITGGYTTEDLIEKVIDNSGKNPVAKYVLKYPDTIVPPTENSENTNDVPFEV